jgi:4-amino-4-deoxy-L-arabinose transferase-like glycosyltransferase
MSSTATAVGRALQRWGAAALRGIGRPEGWLILLAVTSRWPLRGRWLYHWDSVNFALALDRFDVARGQPHVPGYPLYVGLGWISRRIFGDPQTALVVLSVAGTAMAAVLLYRLGEEWIGRGAGKWAALFWLSSPLVWFYGEIALPHALDAGFVLLVVWLAVRCARGERWHLPLAVALAASSGLRPQNLLFLGPIFLWGLQSQRWRARAEALISLGGLTLLWLIPLLALSGGPGRYLEISRAYNAHFWSSTLVFGPAGLSALQRNLGKLAAYTAYGVAGAGLPLIGGLPALLTLFRRLPQRWLAAVGWGLWVAPALMFHTFIHMGQQGLVLVFLPALLLLAAALAARDGRRGWGLGLAGLALNVVLFLAAPERPLGPEGIRLLNLSTLRRHDATMAGRFALLRAEFPPDRTLIVASQWRFFDFYAPEYPVLPFGLEDPAERPREERVWVRLESEGTGFIVLFEPELTRWVLPRSRPWRWWAYDGVELPGWAWTPGDRWVYGPGGFGLFRGP